MHLNQISPQRPPAARPPRRRQRRWPWLAAAALTACLAAVYPAAAATAGTAAAAARPPRPLNCGAPDFPCSATPRRPMRWPTASRRCCAAESTDAARPWSCPNWPNPVIQGVSHTDIRKDLAAFDSQVRPARGHAAGREHHRPVQDALPGRQRGSRGHRDGARDRARQPASTSSWCPQDATSSSADFAAAMTKVIQKASPCTPR